MPEKKKRYALNLFFDPAKTTGRFEDAPRDWAWSDDGGTSWSPSVNANTTPLTVTRKDEVQFTVASTSAHETVKSVEIVVAFGKVVADGGTWVASPFEDDSGAPRCLLTGPTKPFDSGDFHAHFIGPFRIGKLDSTKAGGGALRFEFVVVAKVTFTNNGVDTVKEYGYDPEMDVGVGI